jgi:hypothetical protein
MLNRNLMIGSGEDRALYIYLWLVFPSLLLLRKIVLLSSHVSRELRSQSFSLTSQTPSNLAFLLQRKGNWSDQDM